MEILPVWETVSTDSGIETMRMKTPGGWMVRNKDVSTSTVTFTFVSDPTWTWEIASE